MTIDTLAEAPSFANNQNVREMEIPQPHTPPTSMMPSYPTNPNPQIPPTTTLHLLCVLKTASPKWTSNPSPSASRRRRAIPAPPPTPHRYRRSNGLYSGCRSRLRVRLRMLKTPTTKRMMRNGTRGSGFRFTALRNPVWKTSPLDVRKLISNIIDT